MEKDRLTNGTLTEEKERNLEESRKAYEALLSNVSSLASSLNRWIDWGMGGGEMVAMAIAICSDCDCDCHCDDWE